MKQRDTTDEHSRRGKVGLYLRVSTFDQSVEMQRMDLRRYCEARQFEIVREYSDVGISGARDRRPGLDALMVDVRRRIIDTVLVWRFDRMFRNTRHMLNIVEEFRHLGTSFISHQENLDTASAIGKTMFILICAMSEFEKHIISERICCGLRRARALGKSIGRPTRAVDLDDIRNKRAAGQSLRQIAHALGVSVSIVHRTLKATKEAPHATGSHQTT